MIALEVEVGCEDWRRLGVGPELARHAADAACSALPERPAGDLAATLLLSDDATVRELNRRWRGQDKATNVLSFPAPPMAGSPRHLGEIALAYGTVAREAERDAVPFEHHASHLIVHGLLHLLGHDHVREVEADVMERIEAAALARLGISDPYAASE